MKRRHHSTYNRYMQRIPVIRDDDGEVLGYVAKERSGWSAQTLFGYVFARSDSRDAIEETVRSQGLGVLQGVWQYYDKQDKRWYPCVLKETYENRVVVVRTNEMGYEDGDNYERVSIVNPNDTNLVKSS